MFFQRKTPKTQAPDKTPYTLYNPNDGEWKEEAWKGRVRVISVDPGLTNFCIRVEERPYQVEMCDDYTIKPLLYEKLKLKRDEIGLDQHQQSHHYTYLINFLDQHLDVFKTCHMMIIERQMPFNYKATRIAQHVISYMMINCRNLATSFLIFEVDSKLKGRELGAGSNLNDRGIKQWAVEVAHEILGLRHDDWSLKVLAKSKKKQDDLADTVCQAEALFKHMQWPITTTLIASQPVGIKLNCA